MSDGMKIADTIYYKGPEELPPFELPRDILGYGEESFDPKWPKGARIAVSFILNYEEGAERNILNGDESSEPYIWEKCHETTQLFGKRHLNGESEFEYGSRVGCWRFLRLFQEFGYKFTLYGVAQAVAKNPAFGKACVRDGHEIGNHGLRWVPGYGKQTDDEQVETIKRAILLLKEVTGETPVGCYWGRLESNTPALVARAHEELGIPLLWESDVYNDDVPYWVDLPQEKSLPNSEKKGMLMVPYDYTMNDYKFVSSAPGPGFPGSFIYEDMLKKHFDMLYEEGGKMMNIPCHSRLVGKAGRMYALKNFMKYISEKEGVWVTTRKEIATHFRKEFPYVPGELAVAKK